MITELLCGRRRFKPRPDQHTGSLNIINSGESAAFVMTSVMSQMNPIMMTSYFPGAGNLNGSNADMCSDVVEPSSSDSVDLFDFGSSCRSRTFTISPTTSTIVHHLGFDRDYNSRATFRDVLRHYA